MGKYWISFVLWFDDYTVVNNAGKCLLMVCCKAERTGTHFGADHGTQQFFFFWPRVWGGRGRRGVKISKLTVLLYATYLWLTVISIEMNKESQSRL